MSLRSPRTPLTSRLSWGISLTTAVAVGATTLAYVGGAAAEAGTSSTSTGSTSTSTSSTGTSSTSTGTAASAAALSSGPSALATTLAVRPTRWSKLAWPSGVFVGAGDRAAHEKFGTWRGHNLDVILSFTGRSTWDEVINPSWLFSRWKGTRYTKVFSLPPFPESGASMASCAAGNYDTKWRQFGRNIKAAGLDDKSIIRLAWEMNGNWFAWSARNPVDFKRCWRHVMVSAEQTAPKLRWDWTVNRGRGQSVADARKAYPGDKYVDFIGVDSYDMWPAATSSKGWSEHYSGAYGLKFWLTFARAHHKRFTVPEWGLHSGPSTLGESGRDNPYFIKKMTAFFKANATFLGYEAYFNERDPYIQNALYGPVQNPKAARAYRAALS